MNFSILSLRLLSLLPERILGSLSSFLCFLLKVLAYRKSVIETNLRLSFPEKSSAEIMQLRNAFYSHLADLFVESIIGLKISESEVLKRYRCVNPEMLDRYQGTEKSLIFVSGHYNNWEYMVLSLALQFPYHGVGVGKNLSDAKLDIWLNAYRQRFGTEVVFSSNVREKFSLYEQQKRPSIFMMLIDQSPNDKNKAYWMNFLHQDSAVIYGAEYFARKYNYPVIFYIVRKVSRGYYEFELKEVTDQPMQLPQGEITQRCMHLLEKEIEKEPPYWIWSHRRWKHKRDTEDR